MKHKRGVLAALVSLCMAASTAMASAGNAPLNMHAHLSQIRATAAHTDSFIVDNVPVTLTSRLATGRFQTTRPGTPNQSATFFSATPYVHVYIQAVPYGFAEPANGLMVAVPGIASTLRKAISATRAVSSLGVARAASASIFGQTVNGEIRFSQSTTTGSEGIGTADFTAEAGGRLWLLQIEEELPGGSARGTAMQRFAESVQGLTLQSNQLNRRSSLSREVLPSRFIMRLAHPPKQTAQSLQSAIRHGLYYTGYNVAFPPSWWTVQPNTPCDYQNYWNNTPSSVPAAFALYPSTNVPNPWHGLQACGPNPYKYANGSADVLVHFFSGAWGVYEWECVELAMRWMREAYGTVPYSANGNTVASNYRTSYGGNLQYVPNGGYPPLPVPGDVLSYNGGTFGHTSVVVWESHNSSGTGGLYVIEENDGNYAGDYLAETNWLVNCSAYNGECPSAWLHQP